MPIVLADRRKPTEVRFGDAVIRMYVAGGDLVLSAMHRAAASAADASPAEAAARGSETVLELAAACVVGWDGVVDGSGAAVPWPESGSAVGIDGLPAPSREALAARRELLRSLPWNVLASLESDLGRAWSEASASGKGSGTVSSG